MPDMSNLSDEQILARVMGQPETSQIAATLGLAVEDYAKMVLHYVRNPEAEPQVEVVSDDEARQVGMPSAAACVVFLEGAVGEEINRGEAHFAGFDSEEKSAATLTGNGGPRIAPREGEARGVIVADEGSETASQLQQELKNVRRRRV